MGNGLRIATDNWGSVLLEDQQSISDENCGSWSHRHCVGSYHTLFVKYDGSLWGMGKNHTGNWELEITTASHPRF